jgi:hypothetical protein
MTAAFLVLVFNPHAESCADSIAAVLRHSQPRRIEIWFVQSEQNPNVPVPGLQQQEFLQRVHQAISQLSTDSPAYAAALHMTISTGESVRPDNVEQALHGASGVDVTSLPKEISLNLVAASLMGAGTPVFAVRWLTKFEPGTRHRVGSQPYVYEDLVKLPKARTLRRAFRARAHVLASVGIVIFLVATAAALSNWLPALKPISEILNAVSVAAGFAGLWIAVAEERRAI